MAGDTLQKLRITAMAADDLDGAAAFVCKHWRETYRPHLPGGLLRARHVGDFRDRLEARMPHCWLAWLGERLAGLVSTNSNCIDDLWVASRFRRRGIGGRLVETVSDSLHQRGFQFVQTGCEDFNDPAIAFLTAAGWSKIGDESLQISHGRQVRAWVFSRRLPQLAAG